MVRWAVDLPFFSLGIFLSRWAWTIVTGWVSGESEWMDHEIQGGCLVRWLSTTHTWWVSGEVSMDHSQGGYLMRWAWTTHRVGKHLVSVGSLTGWVYGEVSIGPLTGWVSRMRWVWTSLTGWVSQWGRIYGPLIRVGIWWPFTWWMILKHVRNYEVCWCQVNALDSHHCHKSTYNFTLIISRFQ